MSRSITAAPVSGHELLRLGDSGGCIGGPGDETGTQVAADEVEKPASVWTIASELPVPLPQS